MMRRLSSQTMVAGWCGGVVPCVCVCAHAWGWVLSEIGRSIELLEGGWAIWTALPAGGRFESRRVAAFKIEIDPARSIQTGPRQAGAGPQQLLPVPVPRAAPEAASPGRKASGATKVKFPTRPGITRLRPVSPEGQQRAARPNGLDEEQVWLSRCGCLWLDVRLDGGQDTREIDHQGSSSSNLKVEIFKRSCVII